jgi:hypothetical protein
MELIDDRIKEKVKNNSKKYPTYAMEYIDVAMEIPFAMGIIPQPFPQYYDAENSSDVFNERERKGTYDDSDDKRISL